MPVNYWGVYYYTTDNQVNIFNLVLSIQRWISSRCLSSSSRSTRRFRHWVLDWNDLPSRQFYLQSQIDHNLIRRLSNILIVSTTFSNEIEFLVQETRFPGSFKINTFIFLEIVEFQVLGECVQLFFIERLVKKHGNLIDLSAQILKR